MHNVSLLAVLCNAFFLNLSQMPSKITPIIIIIIIIITIIIEPPSCVIPDHNKIRHASNGGNQPIPPKLPPIIIIVVIIMPQLLDCQKDSQCLPPFILSLLFQTSMLPPASHLLLKLVRMREKRKGDQIMSTDGRDL
ncbi:hypothetical protein NEUTE2DRAFT_144679 [Neurospora tetrasperma FGSC 2509]|nr:hypothetical protein NEUTE2DRAFT_144679 [Neurospora tetrasperma FGSC 2509]